MPKSKIKTHLPVSESVGKGKRKLTPKVQSEIYGQKEGYEPDKAQLTADEVYADIANSSSLQEGLFKVAVGARKGGAIEQAIMLSTMAFFMLPSPGVEAKSLPATKKLPGKGGAHSLVKQADTHQISMKAAETASAKEFIANPAASSGYQDSRAADLAYHQRIAQLRQQAEKIVLPQKSSSSSTGFTTENIPVPTAAAPIRSKAKSKNVNSCLTMQQKDQSTQIAQEDQVSQQEQMQQRFLKFIEPLLKNPDLLNMTLDLDYLTQQWVNQFTNGEPIDIADFYRRLYESFGIAIGVVPGSDCTVYNIYANGSLIASGTENMVNWIINNLQFYASTDAVGGIEIGFGFGKGDSFRKIKSINSKFWGTNRTFIGFVGDPDLPYGEFDAEYMQVNKVAATYSTIKVNTLDASDSTLNLGPNIEMQTVSLDGGSIEIPPTGVGNSTIDGLTGSIVMPIPFWGENAELRNLNVTRLDVGCVNDINDVDGLQNTQSAVSVSPSDNTMWQGAVENFYVPTNNSYPLCVLATNCGQIDPVLSNFYIYYDLTIGNTISCTNIAASSTVTPTPTPTATAAIIVSATPTASTSASLSSSSSTSPSASASSSASSSSSTSSSASASATTTSTVSLSATITPTATGSPTATRSGTRTGSSTRTPSPTTTMTITATPTSTNSVLISLSVTTTPTGSSTPSGVLTASLSATPTGSVTATQTQTPSQTSSSSSTGSTTATGTPSPSPTTTPGFIFFAKQALVANNGVTPSCTPLMQAVLEHVTEHNPGLLNSLSLFLNDVSNSFQQGLMKFLGADLSTYDITVENISSEVNSAPTNQPPSPQPTLKATRAPSSEFFPTYQQPVANVGEAAVVKRYYGAK